MNALHQKKTEAPATPSIAVQELDQQIVTAKAYPRDVTQFLSDSTALVSYSEEIAEQCMFGLPRGGKIITGASIRFAEIIFGLWGNCICGSKPVDETHDSVFSEGRFRDLQSNTMIQKVSSRRILDKNGNRYNADMITMTANAAASIAMRNAILAGIPEAIWQSVYHAARTKAVGAPAKLDENRQRAVAFFMQHDIDQPTMLALIGIQKMEDIQSEQLALLKGMMISLKDGDTDAEKLIKNLPAHLRPKAKTAPAAKPATPAAETNPAEPALAQSTVVEAFKEVFSNPDAPAPNLPEGATKVDF